MQDIMDLITNGFGKTSSFMTKTSPFWGLSWMTLFTYYVMIKSKVSRIIGIVLSLINVALVGGLIWLVWTYKDVILNYINTHFM